MNAPKESYPLTWPDNWPRTPLDKIWRSRFRNVQMGHVCECLLEELRRLKATEIVISCNLQVRLDGRPYAQQQQPKDKGIAVYFKLKRPTVLACDRWNRTEDNVWAIAKHIEALRGQDRWGVGSIDQAFAGYAQLPAFGQTSGIQWWKELGVPIKATAEIIQAAYRLRVKQVHPDAGGCADAFNRLNEAYRMAMDQNGRKH